MPEVHIKRDFSIPAAVQFKNPGAMWPGAVATKWGSTKWQYLGDGTGQGGGGHGNKIAIFDNWVDGICAQLDLWRTSPNYKNKKFKDAINIWDGGNHTPDYIAHVKRHVPGMTEDTVMDDKFWRGPMAMTFLKVQAAHEAGKPSIPAPDADWIEAQRRVFASVTKQKVTSTAAVVAGAGGTAAVVAHQGLNWLEIGLSAFIVAGIVTAVILLIRKFRS